MLDRSAIIEQDELRDLVRAVVREELRERALVDKRALLMVVSYWDKAGVFRVQQHPYRLAIKTIVGFIKGRYGG